MDETLPESLVVQQKNAEVLRTSTSGGFFTAISKLAIELGGFVLRVAFGEDMELRHSYAETLEDCKKSAVPIHTYHGREVFDKIRVDYVCHEFNIALIFKRKGVMIKHLVPINPRRNVFSKTWIRCL